MLALRRRNISCARRCCPHSSLTRQFRQPHTHQASTFQQPPRTRINDKAADSGRNRQQSNRMSLGYGRHCTVGGAASQCGDQVQRVRNPPGPHCMFDHRETIQRCRPIRILARSLRHLVERSVQISARQNLFQPFSGRYQLQSRSRGVRHVCCGHDVPIWRITAKSALSCSCKWWK